MADIIQVRRDLAANWTSANPTLAQGELGLETDTLKIKYGDGSTAWNSLGYFVAAADGKVKIDSGATPDYLGAANSDGVLRTDATLDYTDGGNFITLSLDSTLKSNYDAAFSHVSADGSSHADVVTNSAKNTNVPTALEVGTVGVNTVAITSDGGADDVTLPAALVNAAGMLTTAKWAEIVVNSQHTADNSQAHTDYLINNGDDETSGVLTAAGFTVGSMALTDGVVTDATGLSLVANTSVTGDFIVNTTDFVIDTATGRVGFGIANPLTTVEIKGTLSIYDDTKVVGAGITTEGTTKTLVIGINEGSGNRFGSSYTQALQGGMLIIDTRATEDIFNFYGRAAGVANASGSRILTIGPTGKMTFKSSTDSSSDANEVTIGGYEIGANNRVLAIGSETAVVADADESKFSNKLQCRINGVTYFIMLTTT